MLQPHAQQGFHPADYVIFILVLLVSIFIGLYYAFTGGKQRTTSEFLMGNHKLQTVPVSLSILVSFVSAILVLGTPAEMYTRGTQLTMRTIGYCIAIFLSSQLLVPLFFSLRVTSSFEYLERRYNSRHVKLMGTFMMIFANLFYMGLVMYTPSTALQAVTGFPLWASILCTGLVSTLYTTVGGMKAVIWTDVFQAVVMISGMLAIVIQGAIKVGGLEKVWSLSEKGGRLIFFNFNPDPSQRLSFWSLVFGGMFSTLTIFGVGQTSVQRYCALPTLAQAKRSVYLNIPGILIINILATLVGLVIYAYYAELGCDPIKQKLIANSNQLVPYFMIDVLNYPGFPGIFLAVLFSGALSSMSSCLNALAAVTWQDILQNTFHKISEVKKATTAKVLVVVYGMAAITISFATDNIGVHVLQASLSFTGATSGPSLGMFLLGALFSQANALGAAVGCIVSLTFCLWIAIGAFVTRPYKHTTLPTSTEGCVAVTSLVNDWNFTQPFSSVTHIGEVTWGDDIIGGITTPLPVSPEPESLVGLQKLYGISFLWYSAIGCILTIFIGLLVSIIVNKLRGQTDEVDEKLLIPVMRNLFSCFACCDAKRDMETELHDIESNEHSTKEQIEQVANGSSIPARHTSRYCDSEQRNSDEEIHLMKT